MFGRHSLRRRRWRYSVLQRFPDEPAELSHCHVLVDVEWIAIPAGYKRGCQAAIDLPATAHGFSNNLVLNTHPPGVGVGVGVTVGVTVGVAVGVTEAVGVAVGVAVAVTVAVGVAVGVTVAVAVAVAVWRCCRGGRSCCRSRWRRSGCCRCGRRGSRCWS